MIVIVTVIERKARDYQRYQKNFFFVIVTKKCQSRRTLPAINAEVHRQKYCWNSSIYKMNIFFGWISLCKNNNRIGSTNIKYRGIEIHPIFRKSGLSKIFQRFWLIWFISVVERQNRIQRQLKKIDMKVVQTMMHDVQWVEKFSIHPLYSSFLFCFMKSNVRSFY